MGTSEWAVIIAAIAIVANPAFKFAFWMWDQAWGNNKQSSTTFPSIAPIQPCSNHSDMMTEKLCDSRVSNIERMVSDIKEYLGKEVSDLKRSVRRMEKKFDRHLDQHPIEMECDDYD